MNENELFLKKIKHELDAYTFVNALKEIRVIYNQYVELSKEHEEAHELVKDGFYSFVYKMRTIAEG